MGNYIPSTNDEQSAMLSSIGLKAGDELFGVVPEAMKVKQLDLPHGMSELETSQKMRGIAAKNKVFSTIFRGAGAYNHFIPSIVKNVVNKEEFLTAYTPYQAEISQGILQSIFEYQTMICELTGLAVSNASVYDGASAAAEAFAMCRDRKHNKILVSAAANPMVIQTIQTYAWGANAEVELVPLKDGRTDCDALKKLLDNTTACVYIQQPNYYGLLEDANIVGEIAHAAGAKYIMGVNPIATTILQTPQECNADIAVGEGQPLGMPLSFGGPYLGFMAASSAMMRKLPGRIVGETKDVDGKRAYVLTLQAREQHIRREKASSNICSNQALCALTASVYMTAMGAAGMSQAARLCYDKAHYAAQQISSVKGFDLRYNDEFFHEFVTEVPGDVTSVLKKLEEHDILGGYEVDGGILWCCTEVNTKAEIDQLVALLQEVAK